MAKSTAERQKEYKASRKQLNCFISELAYQSLADLAAEQGKTKIEVLETLLLDNNSLPSNMSLSSNDSKQSEIKALEDKNELLAIELENSTRDINNMNARYEMLSNELKAAKGKQAHKGHDAKYWCENYERQKREFDVLEKRLKELENKFDIGTGKTCQCVTSNRTQCTRPADKLIQVNDLMFWTCKQHRAKYPNATQVF